MIPALKFQTAGAAYAGIVRAMSSGPEWNAGLITANRGRFSRLPQDQKRELWGAMKETGGVQA